MRILLHAGHFKTGSTALQVALGRQRDDLLGQGVLVPHTPRGNHGYLLNPLHAQRFQQAMSQLRQEIYAATLQGVNWTVLSAEVLSYLHPSQLQELACALADWPIEVLLVLRPWRDYLPARYAQNVFSGDSQGLAQWLQQLPEEGHPDADFALVLQRLARITNALHVVPYGPDAALLALGRCLGLAEQWWQPAEQSEAPINSRMDWLERELLRFCNGHIGPLLGRSPDAKNRQAVEPWRAEPQILARDFVRSEREKRVAWVDNLSSWIQPRAQRVCMAELLRAERVEGWALRLQANLPAACADQWEMQAFAHLGTAEETLIEERFWAEPALQKAAGQMLQAWQTWSHEKSAGVG